VRKATIDEAVRRVLHLKARLGLFDDPYGRTRRSVAKEEYRALAREAAVRSIVLLKNRDGLLPLRSDVRRIAVIGPLAEARRAMVGPAAANVFADEALSIVEGLRSALPACEVTSAAGVEFEGDDASGIAAAVELARNADAVVLCVGEAPAMSGEAASRARLDLPGRQGELARAVLGAGRPVVALLSSGRPLTVPWLMEQAQAVFAAWFLGSEAGHGIADILTGRRNPSGRLPVTWPVDVGQIPIFYGQRPSGRPADPKLSYTSKYIDVPVEPQFPFGHGLSYTRFEYSNLRAEPPEIRLDGQVVIEVEVANAGARAGEETVMLFVHDPVASMARPLLELKGFAKVALEAGAQKTVRFVVTAAELTFLDANLAPRLEPGAFEFLVGPSAERSRLLRASVRLLADGS